MSLIFIKQMKFIPRHVIATKDVSQTIKLRDGVIDSLFDIIKENPDQLGALYSECLRAFGYAFVVDENFSKARSLFSIAQKSIVAHFQLAGFPDKKIIIHLGDRIFNLNGYKAADNINTADWRTALSMSVILKDNKGIEHLLQVSESVLRLSEVKGDEFNFKYVEFLKSLWDPNKRKDTESLLLEVYDLIEKKNIKIQSHDLVLRLIYPQLAMYTAIISDNHAEFNNRLYQALDLWKGFCEEMNPNSPLNFFNFTLTSITTLAHARKIPIEVESDYMPKEMIEGTW
jgi:hypothetical protein